MTNIYFIGTASNVKGLDDFHWLATQLPALSFHWFSYKLDQGIVESYRNIIFHKSLDDAELYKTVKREMDIFISCSRFEGFCLPIAEAILLEKPAISYDLEEIKCTFNDHVEYVPCYDVHIYKKILTDLIKKKINRKKILLAKRYVEENFSPEIVSTRFLRIVTSDCV
jgi:glycosyltransferase involved in cell wall biosynthesis